MLKNHLSFFLSARKNGHRVHSAYLYNFAIKVLNIDNFTKKNIKIEKKRHKLLRDKTILQLHDLGAGSRRRKSNFSTVKKIAKYSLTPPKYCIMLQNLVDFTNAANVLEFGTSLGITALYLKNANNNPNVTTIEGDPAVANIARNLFSECNKNITLINTDFDSFIDNDLNTGTKYDFFFIDGNHRKMPTLKYFDFAMKKATKNAVIVFDDIRWSKEMLQAWNEIANADFNGAVVELFRMGIIFLNDNFLEKQFVKMKF